MECNGGIGAGCAASRTFVKRCRDGYLRELRVVLQ